jgi:hypothetical protein
MSQATARSSFSEEPPTSCDAAIVQRAQVGCIASHVAIPSDTKSEDLAAPAPSLLVNYWGMHHACVRAFAPLSERVQASLHF